MNETLLDRIRPVAKRLRSVRFWRLLSVITCFGAMSAWLLQQEVAAGETSGTQLGRMLLLVVLAIAVMAYLLCRFSFRNPRAVARQIEEHFPSLDQRLLTALSQHEEKLSYCLLYTSPSPRDRTRSRMPSSA